MVSAEPLDLETVFEQNAGTINIQPKSCFDFSPSRLADAPRRRPARPPQDGPTGLQARPQTAQRAPRWPRRRPRRPQRTRSQPQEGAK
eukprot:2920250-Pyramimonas_sp.AAC.1